MEQFLLWVILAMAAFQAWCGVKFLDELRETRSQLLQMMGTTQSRMKMQNRSDPYPDIPKSKVKQRYEHQGTPQPKPGDALKSSTASGTPVRIGRIKRKLAGGSSGDASDSGLPTVEG